MSIDAGRVGAVVSKELTEFRRKRSIVVAMLVLPSIFLIEPILTVLLGARDPRATPAIGGHSCS